LSHQLVREIDDSAAFVLLKCFRGDDDAIPHAKQLFLKLLANLDVKDIVLEMDDNYRRSEYILDLLTKDEFHPRTMRRLKAKSRDEFRELRRTLAFSLENFAGLALVEEITKLQLPWSGLHSDWGAIACWELRKRAFMALARLLYVLRGELGGAERFIYYLPHMRSYYAAIYKGSESKLEDEKMVLQAIVSAAFHPSGFPIEQLEEYIKQGMAVVGLHWATGLNPELTPTYLAAKKEWVDLHTYAKAEELRKWMDETLAKSPHGRLRLQMLTPYVEGMNKNGEARSNVFTELIPTPFFEVPKEHWRYVLSKTDMLPSRLLSGNITLKPIHMSELGCLFPREKMTPTEGVFGLKGSGKTTLTSAIDLARIRRGYVVFQPTIKREQAILSCLPCLPVCAQAKRDHAFLTERLKIQPQPVPCKFLTVCQNESQISGDAVWTIHDEIILVDKLSDFALDWDAVLDGFPRGKLIVRRLRSDRDTNTMRANVISSFFAHRELNRRRKIALGVDELQDVLMAQVFSKAEAEILGAASRVLADIRGLNLPFTFSAIRPALIQPEALEACTSIFFSQLGESGSEASRSTKSRILDVVKKSFLRDEDAMYLPAVERMMANRPLARLKLFFWAALDQPLKLVTGCLPSHMTELTNVDLRDIFKAVEKETGEAILVDASDVPRQRLSATKAKAKRDQEQYIVHG